MGTHTDQPIQTTLLYAAPEVLNCDSIVIDEKPDMFSLGVIFQEMITLTKPKPASRRKHEKMPAGIPLPLIRYIKRMKHDDPSARPSLTQLLGRLNAMEEDEDLTDSVLEIIRYVSLKK